MQSGIKLTKIWSDEDVLELEMEISDGTSLFCHKAYISPTDLADLITDLTKFKDRVHGGIYDMKIGQFGPEYASGALHARLHFRQSTKLFITAHAQADFKDFSLMKVASEVTLYIFVRCRLY